MKLFYVTFLSLGIALLHGCEASEGMSHDEVVAQVASHHVYAADLYDEVVGNAAAAQVKYKDDFLIVTGTMWRVSIRNDGYPVVFVGEWERGRGGIECVFGKYAIDDLAAIKSGEAIRVKGQFYQFGILSYGVPLRNCVFPES